MNEVSGMFNKKKQITKVEAGQWREAWGRLSRNKVSMVALAFLILIILLAVFADVIVDYETVITINAEERMLTPSAEHWFGTDHMGRDLFGRVIHGARYSLLFGVICTSMSLFGGCVLGATAAYFGGKIDLWITRIVDALMCIPYMLLSLSLVAAMGSGFKSMMLAMIIASVPSFTRMIRSVVLTVVRQDYIEAARSCGVKDTTIIFCHVLPNAIGPIIVNAMMNVAGLIMSAASLSFIGMGIQPPAPEWGNMLNEGTSWMRQCPHMIIFPGLAIVLTALCFNLLGDGLTEALDPRQSEQ